MNTTVPVTPQVVIGRVKWFNNKSGFGFITLVGENEIESDIFVHHSAIQVDSEQYKYLVQGEYVEFKLIKMTEGKHEYQAGSVSGIKGGKLMCVTRREFRETRTNYKVESGEETEVRPPTKSYVPKSVAPPRVRGPGPREGAQGTGTQGTGAEWTYVVKNNKPPDSAKARKSRVDKA